MLQDKVNLTVALGLSAVQKYNINLKGDQWAQIQDFLDLLLQSSFK